MSIYIPKKINVGYQNRLDTYTGKLAYVIYFDEKGKLRKEASWQSWRNKDIPSNVFDNTPTEGFVLNKKVGDYSSGWDHRKSYCRIYDPRGFEFEITIENLLYILENATSTKGKGLEGNFVYGWDGKDLILIPTESPDYKSIIEYSDIVNNNNHVKVKDLIIGATYLDKNNVKFVYMGRYDMWHSGLKKDGKIFRYSDEMYIYCKTNNIPPDKEEKGSHSWQSNRLIWEPDETGYYTFDKCHVFYYESKMKEPCFIWLKSLGNKFISCVDKECRADYADLFDKLECTETYSPIDNSKEKHINLTYDEFTQSINKYGSYWEVPVYCNEDDVIHIYKYDEGYRIKKDDIARQYGFEIGKRGYGCNYNMNSVDLKTIFDALHPYYKEIYLANGRLLRRVGYYL